MRSSAHVRELLIEKGIDHELVELSGHCRTAASAAGLLSVPIADVAKSLLFRADGDPVLVVVPGHLTVDTGLLAGALDAREIVLARARDVVETTGYEPGAVPPCALEHPVRLVADPRVLDRDVVYCGGGTVTTMLKIRSADLAALVRPQVAGVGVKPGLTGGGPVEQSEVERA